MADLKEKALVRSLAKKRVSEIVEASRAKIAKEKEMHMKRLANLRAEFEAKMKSKTKSLKNK